MGKQDDAATKIQSNWRGALARIKVEKIMEDLMREELAEAATKLQSLSRGRSSRKRTSARLETMMENEITVAATKIQTSFRGRKARKDFEHLSSLSNTPRNDDEAHPRHGDGKISNAGFAFLKATRYSRPTQLLQKVEEAPKTVALRARIEELQKRAGRLCNSVNSLEPVFSGKSDQVSKIPEVQAMRRPRPFQNLIEHSLPELCVAIVGRTALSVAIATSLARCGLEQLVFFESNKSASENTPGLLKMAEIKKMMRQVSSHMTVTVCTLDFENENDQQDFQSKLAKVNFVLLGSNDDVYKLVVAESANKHGLPWMRSVFEEDRMSFHFQFFLQDVAPVLPHDIVVRPLDEHLLSKMKDLESVLEAMLSGATLTFGALTAANIIKFWLASTGIHGYVWFNPIYGKFSTLNINDMRRKGRPDLKS